MEQTDAAAPVVRVRYKKIRWSASLRHAFLDHLAEGCNVAAAARAIGVLPASVHQLRRRDAGFAAEWDAALEHGYALLETRILGHVLLGAGRQDPIEAVAREGAPLHFEDALRVLAIRDARRAGRGGGHRIPRRATREETKKLILSKLRALEARGVKS